MLILRQKNCIFEHRPTTYDILSGTVTPPLVGDLYSPPQGGGPRTARVGRLAHSVELVKNCAANVVILLACWQSTVLCCEVLQAYYCRCLESRQCNGPWCWPSIAGLVVSLGQPCPVNLLYNTPRDLRNTPDPPAWRTYGRTYRNAISLQLCTRILYTSVLLSLRSSLAEDV